MGDPDLAGAHSSMVPVQLVPVGMVGDHQRQLDAALSRPLRAPASSREANADDRIGQPARPAVLRSAEGGAMTICAGKSRPCWRRVAGRSGPSATPSDS